MIAFHQTIVQLHISDHLADPKLESAQAGRTQPLFQTVYKKLQTQRRMSALQQVLPGIDHYAASFRERTLITQRYARRHLEEREYEANAALKSA